MGVLKRIIKLCICMFVVIMCSFSANATTLYRTGDYLINQSGLLAPISCVKWTGYTVSQVKTENHGPAYFYDASDNAYTYSSTAAANTYNAEVQIQSIDTNIGLASEANLYSYPFVSYNTNKTIPQGTYHVTKQAGMFFYVDAGGYQGWVKDIATTTTPNDTGFLTDDKAIDVTINRYLIPDEYRDGEKMVPTYITIHNTANTSSSATALSHAKYLYNEYNRGTTANWHFTVDQSSIYQQLPTNEIGYHAGDSKLSGNTSSIGIEICENQGANMKSAETNAAKLAASLLCKYNLDISRLKRHYDWTGKDCPHNLINMIGGSMGWSAFTQLVSAYINQIKTGTVVNASSTTNTPSKTNTVKAPKKETITSLKAGKKKLTVKYKKISGCSYQVSVKKSGSSWKYYSTSATSKTVTGLSRKKKYSVRVRAKKSDKYGSWSTTRTVKVK